ncbi:MAG: hypothetical protein LBD30_00225 [Verrucomicrobiales bacterium]|jgi:hypothetical protein|nr:hypothetical protein [Verrucomicrobiales bacterium]
MSNTISARLSFNISEFQAKAKAVNDRLNELGKTLISVNVTLVSAAKPIGPAHNQFTAVADTGSQLRSLSAQTGQSVKDLVLLQQAFKNVSLSADQVPAAAAKLQKAIGGVSEEGKDTAEAFRRLGVSAAAIKNLSFVDQLAALSAGFQRITSAAERGAVAQAIFGRTGAQMLAVFADGGGLEQAAREVGGMAVLMDQNAAAFDSFSNHVRTAKAKLDELVAAVLEKVAPALDKFFGAMAETDVAGTVSGLLEPFVNLATLLVRLKNHIIGIGVAFLAWKFMPQMAAAMSAAIGGIRAALTALQTQLTAFRTQLTGAGGGFAALRTAGVACFTAIKGAIAATGIGLAIIAIGEALSWVMGKFGTWKQNWAETVTAVTALNKEAAAFNAQYRAAFASVTGEDSRARALDDINRKIDEQRQKLADAAEKDLNVAQWKLLEDTVNSNVKILEIYRKNLAALSQEQMAANAERILEEQRVAEVERRALELRKNLGKQEEGLQKAQRDAILATLNPLERRNFFMEELGVASEAALNLELARLRVLYAQGTLTNEQVVRYSQLVGLQTELVNGGAEAVKFSKEQAKSELEREEIQRQRRLADLSERKQLVDLDPLATKADKEAQLRPILEAQRAELEANIEKWLELAEARRLAGDVEGMDAMLAKISAAKLQLAEIVNDPALLSFGDTLTARLVSFTDGFGTMAQQVGSAITNTIGSAISGVSQGISGLIMGTTTWRDAMRQTVGSIISSLVQVGVQMVATNLLGMMLGKKSTAATVTDNAAIAASAAPAAALNSIASWGTAAAVGMAAVMAGLILVMSLVGGFASGGLIPGQSSDRDNRLAAVATGEYVVRSAAVRKYGAGLFDALNSMRVPDGDLMNLFPVPLPRRTLAFAGGGLVGDPPTLAEAAGRETNIYVFDDRKKMLEQMRADEGQQIIYDAISGRRVDLGMRT